MVERLTAEAPLPELSIFEGADSIKERLERHIRVTGGDRYRATHAARIAAC